MRKAWTQKEIIFLKNHFNDYGSKFCANKLNRSRASVKVKASVLKIIHKPSRSDTKVCLGCFKRKPISCFSPHKLAKLKIQPRCKVCRAAWESKRKKTDKTYRLIHTIRNRIRIAIKKNVKSSSSFQLMGCNITFLKKYLSNKFQTGMTWDNHGRWHIDHIIPCSSFDLRCPKQQKICFHYTNLQPLWATDNLSKGKRVIN